jgi:hypothetical protein
MTPSSIRPCRYSQKKDIGENRLMVWYLLRGVVRGLS